MHGFQRTDCVALAPQAAPGRGIMGQPARMVSYPDYWRQQVSWPAAVLLPSGRLPACDAR
jgi:hypothetical protein